MKKFFFLQTFFVNSIDLFVKVWYNGYKERDGVYTRLKQGKEKISKCSLSTKEFY